MQPRHQSVGTADLERSGLQTSERWPSRTPFLDIRRAERSEVAQLRSRLAEQGEGRSRPLNPALTRCFVYAGLTAAAAVSGDFRKVSAMPTISVKTGSSRIGRNTTANSSPRVGRMANQPIQAGRASVRITA